MNMSKASRGMTLFIRADGNHTIGTGHLMRCLAIADAFTDWGGDSVFLAAEEDSRELIEARGYEYLCLNSRWNHLEEELTVLHTIIEERRPQHLLVDSYSVTEAYLQSLYEKTNLIYLDDLNLFHYPCHALINYSPYFHKFEYEKNYSGVKLLLGAAYVPLQKPYSASGKKYIKEVPERVLVLSGGTDRYHFTMGMAELIAKSAIRDNRVYTFVCGKYNRDLELLQKLQEEYKNIICVPGTDRMWDYMKEADLAVSAGGTTLYELCALGVPTICYLLADNQIENVKAFTGSGLMAAAGDIRVNRQQVLQHTMENLTALSRNQAQRQNMSESMQHLIDGKGAQRIVQQIVGAE